MAKAIVIGGGIVGLSTAYFLQKQGFETTIFDKGNFKDNCSVGNMGYLSPSHFVPMAAPGMVEQGIFWMFDRKSPFYIRPEWSWNLVKWGYQFVRSANKRHVERSVRPLLELLLLSRDLYFQLEKEEQLDFELTHSGCIIWYKTAKKAAEELENARLAEKLGLSITHLATAEQVAAAEPHLNLEVNGGVWYHDDAHLHPRQLMEKLPAILTQHGVQIFRETPVTGFEKSGKKITKIWTGDRSHEADVIVLAAGSWSPQIAKFLGESLSLMPAKGYSMDIKTPSKQLLHPCILMEAKVALTPFKNSFRIGSTLEIGKINQEIMLPRVQGILQAVPRYLPDFSQEKEFQQLADEHYLRAHQRERVWYGFRPLSPDGLPYIGYSERHENLIYATGHAMIGMSMGIGTGKLVAELAAQQPTSIEIEAFAAGRFG